MTRAWLTLLLAACGGTTGAVPGGPPAGLDGGTDASCTALDAAHASSWVWTRSLQTPSLLRDMRRHASGDVVLAGGLSAALDDYDIHIPSPLGTDPFVFRVDARSGKLVWATSFRATVSDPTANRGVANALAVDGDDVFVTGITYGSSVSFGGKVITFPPPAPGGAPARSFLAKLSAIDGSVVWAVSFDANRTPYDPNVDGECMTVVASGGGIDVGCDYVGANFGLGGFSIKTAPPPGLAIAMLHLVDGASPTLTRAKAYGSDVAMLLTDETRSPNGDVYVAAMSGKTIVDLDDGTTVLASGAGNGVVAKLSPSGSLTIVPSPIPVVVSSKLRYLDDALLLTGVDVAQLDPSLALRWTDTKLHGTLGVSIAAPSGFYVAHATTWDPVSVLALGACGLIGQSYTPFTSFGCLPPSPTIDGLVLEDEGDMVMAGNYDCPQTFDDGTTMTTGYPPKSDFPWSDIYFARRPTF